MSPDLSPDPAVHTCRYCPRPTPNACCGAPECRTLHSAHLFRGLANVLEHSADTVQAARPGVYRDAEGWVRDRRRSAADCRARADELDPPAEGPNGGAA